ncbi:MAG: glycoside-pentoside-hexuronide (GPH):cation symporter [Oscillospiraceae bacterium]|nr:glycoside-pentoside-hexuronide (GPH):cation symporter [Oscillospiraceae bacterium]
MEEKNYASKSEVRAYSIAALGQGLVYSCMSSYITDYYMNVLALDAMFVILLMLLARVWDAINDPLMGMIVDRHQTKRGRLRPYPIITAIPIAILTILMFLPPLGFDVSERTKGMYVYVAVVYVLWGMIYTSSDVPFWSMPNLMTPNPKERGRIISYGRTVGGVGSAVTVALPMIVGYFTAKSSNPDVLKYAIMAISMSVIGMPLFSISSFKVKERISIPNATKRDPNEPSTLSRIFHCKPLMLVVISGILSFGRYMLQSAAPHVARYAGLYIGSKPTTVEQYQSNISTVALVIQVCAAVGMFGTMLLMPKLFKKFEYKTLMISSCLGGFVASVITLIVGWTTQNLLICIPFMIISSIPLGVINVVSGAMVCDCLDYIEWKTGYRDTAVGSACQSFVNKLGNAFATVVIILMYMVVHIDVAAMNSKPEAIVETAMNMGDPQRFAMFALVSIVPGISLLLTAIPMFFYDIVGEKKEKITVELAEMRKERGIVVSEA